MELAFFTAFFTFCCGIDNYLLYEIGVSLNDAFAKLLLLLTFITTFIPFFSAYV